MRGHLQKAVERLREARSLDDGTLLTRDYVTEVQFLLETVTDNLLILEDSLAASIHPAFRTESEARVTTQPPRAEEWAVFPGFRGGKVDQLFYGWMEDYLTNLVTKKGKRLSSAGIDRIISETINKAFGGSYSEERVKMARKRLRKKRATSTQSKSEATVTASRKTKHQESGQN
jgi:hypothetical protein